MLTEYLGTFLVLMNETGLVFNYDILLFLLIMAVNIIHFRKCNSIMKMTNWISLCLEH